jgi:copper transport protein
MSPRRTTPTALVALLIALALPAGASAHATLESASPGAGATLRQAPRVVTLRFDESVETQFGALRVLDARGRRVDDAHVTRPGGRASQLAVGLRRGLGTGGYTVAYRVISDEGHPVSGAFGFQVGARAAVPGASIAPVAPGAGPLTEQAYAMSRGAGNFALALGVGTLLFLVLCWLPALRDVSGAEPRWREAADALMARWALVWWCSVALGALTSLLGLVFQGATAAGTSFVAALDPSILQEVIDTRAGRGWLARLVAWAAMACIVEVAARRRHALPRMRSVALGADGLAVAAPSRGALAAMGAGAGVLVAIPALAGHAAVQSPVPVLLPLIFVHIAAMCAWLGGLTGVATLLPAATRRLQADEGVQLLAATLTRFSRVALAAVIALGASGAAQAALHLHRFGALTDTAYGRALLIKSALLVALIGLGALNRRRTLPRLRAAAAGHETPGAGVAARRLHSTVRDEIALLIAVLGVTGALVGYAPPPPSAATRGPVERQASTGTVDLYVKVGPARIGVNRIDLNAFRTADGLPDTDLHHVSLTATPPSASGAPVTFDAQRVGPGHYVVPTAPLTVAGRWRLRVSNHMPGMPGNIATVDVPIR